MGAGTGGGTGGGVESLIEVYREAFTTEQIAKGQQVAEYYDNLDMGGPIPPDETKTHNFRNIAEVAQSETTATNIDDKED